MVKEISYKIGNRQLNYNYLSFGYIDGQIDYFSVNESHGRTLTIEEDDIKILLILEKRNEDTIIRTIFKHALKFIEGQ